MTITLNKSYFARNKSREKDGGGIFSLIHKNLSFLTNVAFLIVLAPTVVVGSLLSHASFLMIANIFLALGFLFNFFNRIYMREISVEEVVITLVVIGLLCLLAIYLAPAVSSWGLISTLCFVNLFSTSIIAFFLARNFLVPPLLSGMRSIGNALGFKLDTSFYYMSPLELENEGEPEKDRSLIDRLLMKLYGHNSRSKENQETLSQELASINKVIKILSKYINKYDEPIFGYINNNEKIKTLEGALTKLVVNCDTDGCSGFLKRKISYKQTKIEKLQQALCEVNDSQDGLEVRWYRFFNNMPTSNTLLSMKYARELLASEIERQQKKVDDLSKDVPQKLISLV